MRHAVIVTAAGSSCRFNENSNQKQKKEFLTLEGHSVLYRAVEPFTQIDGLVAVVITYQKESYDDTIKALEDLQGKTSVPFFFIEGGCTRQQSVFNALSFLNGKPDLDIDYVSIHDGARPFIKKHLIAFTLASAATYGAAAPAISISDTLIKKDENGFISARLDRTNVCRIQTPQVFRFPDIYLAHLEASENEKNYTDDTEIFCDFGKKVAVIEGDPENKKITYRKDIC